MNNIADRATRWFTDMWNQRDRRMIVEGMAEDVRGHTESGVIVGRDAWIASVFEPFIGAFPDLKLDVEGTVCQGDEVVVRWQFSGTHQGDALGVPACGKFVSFAGMTWLRYRDGKIIEGRDCFNNGGLMMALQSSESQGSVQLR